MPDKEIEQELTPDEEFEAAFNEEPAEEEEPQDTGDEPELQDDQEPAGEEHADDDPGEPEGGEPAADGQDTSDGDIWDSLNEKQKLELLRLQQKSQEWEHRYKSNEGRFRAAQKFLEERNKNQKQTRQPTTEEVQKAFTDSEAFKNFSEEYPDIAKMLTAYGQHVQEATRTNLIQELQPTLAKVHKQEQIFQQTAAGAALRDNAERLSAAHPDWRDIGKSQEYWNWVSTQPPAIQQRAVQSTDADELASLLNHYKAERKVAELETNKDALHKTTQKRERRLAQSRQPIPRSSAPNIDGQPTTFDETFASITK
jgi:hypothetical protein